MDPNNIQATIDLIKQGYSAGGAALGPDVQKDFNLALNLVPYNLEAGARLLFPVMSPIRNMLPRRKGKGKATQFKAITGVNTSNVSIFAREGQVGNQVTTQEVDVILGYVSMGLYDAVTLEGQIQGAGQVDARATAAANLLRAFMISEEQAIMFGQGAAATSASAGGTSVSVGGAVGASPNHVVANATTGGTVPAATYHTFQTVQTGMGESLPGADQPTTTTGATSSITLTPTAVTGKAVLAYNFYVGTSAGGPFVKYTTNGKAVVVTSYAAGAATLPAVDNSALVGDGVTTPRSFNGLLAQIAAQNSGAYVSSLNGPLTTKTPIDNMLRAMWDNGRGDPDQIYVNSFESQSITTFTLGAGAPYFLTVDQQNGATVNYRAERYVNPITGTRVKLDVHPFLPQGNVLALSTKMPQWYPGSDITSVWAMDLPLDYTQLDYFPTGPRWPFEVRTIGALILYLPAIQGWLNGISTS